MSQYHSGSSVSHVNGNQQTRPNNINNRTNEPLVSPVTVEELANYLALTLPLTPADENLLEGLLLTACQYYIDHTYNELLARTWFMRMDRTEERQPAFGGLGPMHSSRAWWSEFRIWPVQSITNAETDGEPLNFEFDPYSKPARIEIASHQKDIVIEYIAGYDTVDEIPRSAINGILMMASYLYEHRGECDSVDAAKNSGAMTVWSSNAMCLFL